MASRDNLLSVKTFFQRYPERAHNDFYLASESYGGHYIPQWTLQVLNDEHTRVHFKGYMLGELTGVLPCVYTDGSAALWRFYVRYKGLANVYVNHHALFAAGNPFTSYGAGSIAMANALWGLQLVPKPLW
jgi:hypothetical protein